MAKARRAILSRGQTLSALRGQMQIVSARIAACAARNARALFQSAKIGAKMMCGEAQKGYELAKKGISDLGAQACETGKREYDRARANAQAANKSAPEWEVSRRESKAGSPVKWSKGDMKKDKLVHDGNPTFSVGIKGTKNYDFLRFGDDDNHLNIGHAEVGVGAGYDYDPVEHEHSFSVFKLEGKAAVVDAQVSQKTAKGLLEGTVKGEALSVAGELNPLSVAWGPKKKQLKGEIGAEANLVKVSGSGQVNVTPKTIYDSTLGRAVGFFSPGSEFAAAPKWLDHGVVLGGGGELGVGAAAKASYELGMKDGVFGTSAGVKVGAGPMAGFNLFLGVK